MPQTEEQKKQSAIILPLFQGKTTKITLPSSREITIRETNGDDDDIISNVSASLDGTNIPNFISAITENDSILGKRPMPEDVMAWHINDKYYALFKQRVFNHGDKLSFSSTCNNPKCEHNAEYHEDLKKFDGDLSDKEYQPESINSINKYILGSQQAVEFVISSGKKLKFNILDSFLEKVALELKDTTKNSPLIIRQLQIENKGEWMRVTHFAGFSSKEMREIHAQVKKHDSQFDPTVNYECEKCQRPYSVSLFSIPAFFYPEELI